MKRESAICPNCGAKGIAGNKCEFCGTSIPLSVVQTNQENKLNELRIVKSELTKDIVIARFLNLLADTKDVSAELFEDIEIEETKKYLVPLYSYKGEYQAPWTCVKLIKETYKYKDKNGTTKYETEIKRYPMNGVAIGSYDRLYPSCDIDQLPKSVSSFITKELYNGECIPDNAIDYRKLEAEDKECLLEDNGKPEKVIWADFKGDSDVYRLMYDAVRIQLPSEYEDDSWSYTSHREAGEKILIPIWALFYTSKGKKYSYVSDDYSKGEIFEYPIDNEYNKGTKDLKKQSESKSTQGCLMGILGVILGVTAFGCFLSACDPHKDIMLTLFFGDVSYVAFVICFLKMKTAMCDSYKVDFQMESFELQHMNDVYTRLVNNIIIPNKFSIEDSISLVLAENIKEKLLNIKVPTLTKSCTWVWPTIIIFLIFVILFNLISFAR